MLTNGPIEASAAIDAVAATSASRWTPATTGVRGENSSTACAKLKYGSGLRSIAHGAPASRSPRMTAEAFVARNSAP